MNRKYYSSRTNSKALTIDDLYFKFKNIYLLFREKDYFLEKIGLSGKDVPDKTMYDVAIKLSFQPFPIERWDSPLINEDCIFDIIEYLYDNISKPGSKEEFESESGFQYLDYGSYDEQQGKAEFREYINMVINDYNIGYELNEEGQILTLGTNGLDILYQADVIPFDEVNVDNKVKHAIAQWRSRKQSLEDRKNIIQELADVFEWLKKTKELERVLDKKDDKLIFDMVNNFSIRHHNPDQKSNYNKTIWYSWMFHFYLATYNAVVRLIIQERKKI